MVYIGKGNHKLPKYIWTFNLPAVQTCIGENGCRKHCYARKAERMYPNVRWSRDYNLSETFMPHFIEFMKEKIQRMMYNARTHKLYYFRIHESGDFYNQKYLDNWKTIAKSFPSVIFYAYTKSPLDFSNRPDNFKVILSDDYHNRDWSQFDGVSTVKYPKEDINDFFRCPLDCEKCHYCMEGSDFKKILFPLH